MKKITFYISILLLAYSCVSSKTKSDDRFIYLVRHAEKMSDSKNPSLTQQGNLRAQSLSKVLSSKDINHIYSTDYNRTKETAQPLAELLEMQINMYDPYDLKGFATQLKQDIKGNVLVVGHSNTTPTLVNLLLESETYEQLDESEYGDLFIIQFTTNGAKDSRSTF